ncbi:MAG TPA: hypothetical protein VHC96_09795, partial [Puia sp.]|nr:hypothetical protein [Puia sp.]
MLKIPPRFKQILNKDPKMAGVVMQTMADFGEILEENKLYFFEEYTDHGIRHIQSVLDFSEVLIQEKTWSILRKTPQTVGIYMLAVILHDLGMHITCEGLHALIQGRNDGIRIKSLDNKTWKELWEKYLDEARRFGDKEKTNIIGNKNWNFRTVDLDNKEKLPEPEDRKLIGEFVRRYHPRLAHEFAINGFPAIAENIPFATGLKEELRDICGLIARSHGMEIRDTFDVLEDKFDEGWIRPYNIEVVFLMVVLRIADYCQIDASRVSAISLRLKNFRSPISRTEHYKHEDTPYTQKSPKDPETLLFYCRPRNSLIFIKLKDLFQSLQQELDRSWAILGEIYGKEQGKWSPCIKYRRVRSNIDTPSKFYKNVNYVPERINFAISSDFSKLLIKPLYGNSPTY